jgi:hypothetical protein
VLEPVPLSTSKNRTARFHFLRATLLEDSSSEIRPCVTGQTVQTYGRTVSSAVRYSQSISWNACSCVGRCYTSSNFGKYSLDHTALYPGILELSIQKSAVFFKYSILNCAAPHTNTELCLGFVSRNKTNNTTTTNFQR